MIKSKSILHNPGWEQFNSLTIVSACSGMYKKLIMQWYHFAMCQCTFITGYMPPDSFSLLYTY